MRRSIVPILFSVTTLLGILACSSAPFINLDFEQAKTNTATFYESQPDPKYLVAIGPIKDLLPGWTLSSSGFPLTEIAFNYSGSLGSAAGIWENSAAELSFLASSPVS